MPASQHLKPNISWWPALLLFSWLVNTHFCGNARDARLPVPSVLLELEQICSRLCACYKWTFDIPMLVTQRLSWGGPEVERWMCIQLINNACAPHRALSKNSHCPGGRERGFPFQHLQKHRRPQSQIRFPFSDFARSIYVQSVTPSGPSRYSRYVAGGNQIASH